MQSIRTPRTRWAVAALVASSVMTLAPGPSQAYQTFNSHRLTFGVSGQRFWLDTTAASTHSPAIHSGVSLWNATASPVSYTETSVKAQSRLDFYRPAHSAVAGACGYTEWFVDTSTVNPSNQNWWWAKVSLTTMLTDEIRCGVQTHRKAIVAHEQGHAMGLAHAILSNRLMYDAIAATNINSPQPDDVLASTTSTERHPMKTRILVALPLAVVLSACGTSEARHSAPRPATASHDVERPLSIHAQATLIAPYFLPTLEDFSRDPFVTAVIEGDVIDAATDVLDEQDSVGTALTIRILRGWGVSGTTIVATEYGGVIPLRKVRGSFEGKEWQRPLTEDDLARPVEYRMEGFPPTHVGDHVVMFLTTKEDGSFGLAAKLVPSGATYGWADGEAPNDIWAKEYDPAQIDRLLTART